MSIEKCIWHPWATDEQGFCWKCAEDRVYLNYTQKPDMIEKPKDDITWEVMQDLASRAKRGVEKYTTTLEENNHDSMLQHAYEEALDLAQYLKKEIKTLGTIQDLVANNPNDMELGQKVREMYRGKK